MDDKFDKYLKQELDSIDNAPIPSSNWDKEKTWKKIALDLKPQPKTISIKWLYSAAALMLIILIGPSLYYRNYTTRISQMKNENDRLLRMIIAQNNSSKQKDNISGKVVTVFQTKETIQREIVYNKAFVHDTITIAKDSETSNDQMTVDNTSVLNDSSVATSPTIPLKKNKLHFVISREPNVVKDTHLLLSSKSFYQTEQDTLRPDNAMKIALN